MTPTGRPKFEVVTPATAEGRLLVPAATIRSITGIPSTGTGAVTDDAINQMTLAALATMARSCRFAQYRAIPPTLAQESVQATWQPDCWDWWPVRAPFRQGQPATLLLPWRAPITSIEIAEGDTDLEEDVDFRLLGSGVVERINGCWATSGNIVAAYVAGFTSATLPADLVSLIGDQVRMSSDRLAIDLNLRSEDVPGVWSGTYNVAGGSSVDTGGLMMPLYDALAAYRAPPSFA